MRISSAILLHLRTHLPDLILQETVLRYMMKRAALAWKLLVFLWLLCTCQAAHPRETGLVEPCPNSIFSIKISGVEDEAAAGIIMIRRIFFSVWKHYQDLLTSVGQPLENCGISLSSSTPCTHFMCYLHMRRRLRQQMLQKREPANIYSDSAQLLISTPLPLSFVSYSWGLVWMGFCLACNVWDTAVAGVFSAWGRRNLVIKSILTCSSRAVKHSTSARKPLTRPEQERGASCRHLPQTEVHLHEPFMK